MAERKVELEINGKRFRVAEHLVSDMMKFGATQTKRTVKEPPAELLQMLPKRVILPVAKEEIVDAVAVPAPKEIILPEAKSPDLELPVKKVTRKKK